MTDEIEVDGLAAPVRVTTDRWGVQHIKADSASDVFFAQGYLVARERMFQLDLWRRRGLGHLSEVFGERFVERDRAARLFLYRGDARQEWLSYSAMTKMAVTRFVAGINQYVGAVRYGETPLTEDFVSLDYLPDFWSPEDISRVRTHGIFANAEQEVARAITLREFGSDVEDLRRLREPWHELVIPDGLDLSVVDESVLDVYRLAFAPATSSELPVPTMPADGSNNWVTAGSRTQSGRPILANDPHRAMSAPSLRYLVHLACPEFDVVGAGEPMLPGVSIGHNGHVAFGLTIHPMDQEDVYVYQLNPDNPDEYLYQDRWMPFERRTETIAVKGSSARNVETAFTRHGPVLRVDEDRHVAFALRAAWLEPGMAPYLASLEYLAAKNVGDHTIALSRWGAPGVNHVFADADGRTGWQATGLVPIRPNWDGLLPVPGDGRYEWAGFRTLDELPTRLDPAEGFVATANQMNLPEEGWEPVEIGYEWFDPFRHRRLTDQLGSRQDWDVESTARLQNDYLSLPAVEVLPRLDGLDTTDTDVRIGLELMRDWDRRVTADSSAALVFDVWFRRHLRPWLYEDAFNRRGLEDFDTAWPRIRPVEDVNGFPRHDLILLEKSLKHHPGGDEAVLAALLTTLGDAVREVRLEHGADASTWTWGDYHHSRMEHPVLAIEPGLVGEPWAQIGPRPKNGGSDTVGLSAHTTEGVATFGASFRLIVDVGAWDGSIAINSPGQSGDPASPHYADLYELWLEDGYFPLAYSDDAVHKHAETDTVLVPSTNNRTEW